MSHDGFRNLALTGSAHWNKEKVWLLRRQKEKKNKIVNYIPQLSEESVFKLSSLLCPPLSSRSSDDCPSPGRSRATTGTKPQRSLPSVGTQPSRESIPPLGAATRSRTEAEPSKDLCPLEPGALALEPAPFCDYRTRTLRCPQLPWSIRPKREKVH